MDPVSAFIQINRKSKNDDVLFAVFKAELQPDSLTFGPISNFGDAFDWKTAVRLVLEEGGVEPSELWDVPCFIYACGHVDSEEIGMTFAIEWGEGVFALAETLHVEDDRIFLGMVSFWYGDESVTDPDNPIENLEIPLARGSIEKIKGLETVFNETVLYLEEGDEPASLRLNGKRATALKGYDKLDQGTWVKEWDDLDDLASISIAWRLALNFED
jgi:hypothetical protein